MQDNSGLGTTADGLRATEEEFNGPMKVVSCWSPSTVEHVFGGKETHFIGTITFLLQQLSVAAT